MACAVTHQVIIKAKNIVNYLTVIYELLAPGGVWINLGAVVSTLLENHLNAESAMFLS